MIKEINNFIRQSRFSNKKSVEVPLHKSLDFDRFPKINLPSPKIEADLLTTLQKRSSSQRGQGHLTQEDLGDIFGASIKKNEAGINRPYPSGGAYYPVETYFIGSIDGGDIYVHHYEPDDHSLSVLWPLANEYNLDSLFSRTEDFSFTGAIIFTMRIDEQPIKYNFFAYQLGLIEAGHIAQNILLTATALDMSTCPHGGYADDVLKEVLDLDPEVEIPIYGISISRSHR